jgi:hypothetical protein
MMAANPPLAPSSEYALINVYRPSTLGFAIKFGVWDGETFMGISKSRTAVQYLAKPGEHTILARAENWYVIKANLEAGKTYSLLAAPMMGAMKARVRVDVLKPGDPNIAEWQKDLRCTKADPAGSKSYVADRVESVRKALDNVASGKAKVDATMGPSDGS